MCRIMTPKSYSAVASHFLDTHPEIEVDVDTFSEKCEIIEDAACKSHLLYPYPNDLNKIKCKDFKPYRTIFPVVTLPNCYYCRYKKKLFGKEFCWKGWSRFKDWKEVVQYFKKGKGKKES